MLLKKHTLLVLVLGAIAYEALIALIAMALGYPSTSWQHFSTLHMQWDALHIFSVAKLGLVQPEIHIMPVLG